MKKTTRSRRQPTLEQRVERDWAHWVEESLGIAIGPDVVITPGYREWAYLGQAERDQAQRLIAEAQQEAHAWKDKYLEALGCASPW